MPTTSLHHRDFVFTTNRHFHVPEFLSDINMDSTSSSCSATRCLPLQHVIFYAESSPRLPI
eukprot:948991-Amphidinium_carterae.1